MIFFENQRSRKKQDKRRSAHEICLRFLVGFQPKWMGQSSSKNIALATQSHYAGQMWPRVGRPCANPSVIKLRISHFLAAIAESS